MDSSRLPRFKRSTKIAPFQLTERDNEIIRHVHRHRFLRSSQIAALMRDGSQQLWRRLQLLYHHGYLERPRAQLDYYHQTGSRPMVYGLGNKGAALVNESPSHPLRRIRWGEKNRAVGRIFLEHALLVSEVMVTLELACRKADQVQLLTEEDLPQTAEMDTEHLIFHWQVSVSGQVKLGVIPDRVFALEYPQPSGKRERAFFFLEADRGTMPVMRRNLTQTSFYRKLLAYESTWSQSLHKTHFGFHRFRVLTLTESAERAKNLVAACAQLERGHGLFLFAPKTVLAEPNLLFSPVWQNGRGLMASLLDGHVPSQVLPEAATLPP